MWIVILILIMAFVIFIIIGLKSEYNPASTKNTLVNRKEVEVNLKDYPNEYKFNVKGVHLDDYIYPVLNICKEFDLISLVAEPNNIYNSDAIKVENSGWHIGYVPAEETHEVHEIIKKENISYIERLDKHGYITITIKIRYKN